MNKDTILRDVAALVGIPADQLRSHDSLADQGMDSLRLITLIETWRAAGHQVDFHDLISHDTLSQWFELDFCEDDA